MPRAEGRNRGLPPTGGPAKHRYFHIRFAVLKQLAFLRAAFSGKLDAVLGAARARLWAVLIAAAGAGSLVWAKALVAGFLKAQKSVKA